MGFIAGMVQVKKLELPGGYRENLGKERKSGKQVIKLSMPERIVKGFWLSGNQKLFVRPWNLIHGMSAPWRVGRTPCFKRWSYGAFVNGIPSINGLPTLNHRRLSASRQVRTLNKLRPSHFTSRKHQLEKKILRALNPDPSLAIGKTMDDEEVGTVFPRK